MKRLLFFLITAVLTTTAFSQSATISGEFTNSNDTLKCVLQVDPVIYQSRIIYIYPVNGKFSIELPVSKPCFMYIFDGKNNINGLIESGDNISIKYNGTNPITSLTFSGKGSEKFSFLNSLYREKLFQRPGYKEELKTAKASAKPFDYLLDQLDAIESTYTKQLESMRPTLSKESYLLLRGELCARLISPRYHAITDIYSESVEETLQKRKEQLSANAIKVINNLLLFDDTYAHVPGYSNAVYNMLFVQHMTLQQDHKMSNSIIDKYNYLDKALPKALRPVVLTYFLDYDIDKLNQTEDLEKVINRTYTTKDSVYHHFILNKFKEVTGFKKGKPAPDFTLEDATGKTVTLSSLKGKVVYLDFWYAACVPCHALFTYMKPVKEHFKNNKDVVFLNISIDKKEVWQKALEKFSIEGYHVFTQNKEAEHPVIKAYKVAGYPTTCLLDKNGNIYAANPASTPVDLIKQIEEALKE